MIAAPLSLRLTFAALIAPTLASAQERLEHHGSLGVLFGGGGIFREATGTGNGEGLRPLASVGLTAALIDDGSELKLAFRGAPGPVATVHAGYRGYFGEDHLKTFLDFDVAANLTPLLAVGPRVGFGAQYDFSALWGIFVAMGGELMFGRSVGYGVDLQAGIQLRSFLLQ